MAHSPSANRRQTIDSAKQQQHLGNQISIGVFNSPPKHTQTKQVTSKATMISRVIRQNVQGLRRSTDNLVSFFRPPASPQLALAPTGPSVNLESALVQKSGGSSLADCLWLAVPKRKVTPGKKRMKTTNQKRIKKKDHIIVDSRTGETTLRHRLPFNWKAYLPGN